MTIDLYTKGVLTLIAAALVALVVQNATQPARAQFGRDCGARILPCHVRIDGPTEVFGTVSTIPR